MSYLLLVCAVLLIKLGELLGMKVEDE